MLGDGVEVSCNSVLNPGTALAWQHQCVIPYPSARLRSGNSIYKAKDDIVIKEVRSRVGSPGLRERREQEEGLKVVK